MSIGTIQCLLNRCDCSILDADLVLWTADPLTTIGGEAWMTFVNGEVVYRAE